MEKNAADFQSWVDRLVHACLPLDLQKKLITLQPLTKEEARKYVQVVQLVTQAKQLKKQDETDKHLANIHQKLQAISNKASEVSGKVDLAIWEASAHNPVYKPADNRTLAAIRELMVDEAVAKLLKDGSLSERSVCENILVRFEKVPGAYVSLDAFRKQVNRKLHKNL